MNLSELCLFKQIKFYPAGSCRYSTDSELFPPLQDGQLIQSLSACVQCLI